MVNKTHEELAQPAFNEKAAVGSLLIDSDYWQELPEFSVDHCLSESNRIILTSITRTIEAGKPVDAVTVSDDLANHGELTNAGGAPYLLELMESVPHAANFEHYAKSVIDHRKRSEIRKRLEQCIESLKLGDDLDTILDDLDFSDHAISENQFEWKTAAELNAAEYNLEYHIENVFVKCQPMAIVAPQKANKTNIACDMWRIHHLKQRWQCRYSVRQGKKCSPCWRRDQMGFRA